MMGLEVRREHGANRVPEVVEQHTEGDTVIRRERNKVDRLNAEQPGTSVDPVAQLWR